MSTTALWVIITLTIVGSRLCNADYDEYEEKKESFWEKFKGFFNIFKKDHKDKKHTFDKGFNFQQGGQGLYNTYPIQIPPIDIPIRPYLPPQEIIHHHHHYHHHTAPQHEVPSFGAPAPIWSAH